MTITPLGDAFLACFKAPMRDVTTDPEATDIDIWPYVDALDEKTRQAVQEHNVTHVYRSADGDFDHVLIGTSRGNDVLAIVVDLRARCVTGHYPLDLGAEYGIG